MARDYEVGELIRPSHVNQITPDDGEIIVGGPDGPIRRPIEDFDNAYLDIDTYVESVNGESGVVVLDIPTDVEVAAIADQAAIDAVADSVIISGHTSTLATHTAAISTLNTEVSRLAAGRVSVLDYGAVADGTTDNSTAFAAVSTAVNAIPNTDGSPIVVEFPGNGTFLYSDGLAFDRPVILTGHATMDYTGTGRAVRLGPLDAVLDDFHTNADYRVEGLRFVGGATMTQGVYFSAWVVEPRVTDVDFYNFGNASAYALFFQAHNWAITVTRCNFRTTYAAGVPVRQRNWIKVNGKEEGGTSDFGQSRLFLSHSHGSNLNTGSGIGIVVNGTRSDINRNKIEGFAPAIRVGNWGMHTGITYNYFEVDKTVTGNALIEYGQPGVVDWLSGLTVEHNYANMHNTDLGLTAWFIGYAEAGIGLQNALVRRNNIVNYDASRAMVRQPDLGGQTGNVAAKNTGVEITGTVGSFVEPWGTGAAVPNMATVDHTVFVVPAGAEVIVADSSGGYVWQDLPSAVGNEGMRVTLKRIGANPAYLQRKSGTTETIDGATNKQLASDLAAMTVISDGANWHIVAQVGSVS